VIRQRRTGHQDVHDGVQALFAACVLGLLIAAQAGQAEEAEATGGTRSSSMWAVYASETTVYRNWPAGPWPTG